jgi:hypothetical protein
MSANRQPDQIIGVGQDVSLIEIVDTPGETAFGVSPSTKIFDVQIANR